MADALYPNFKHSAVKGDFDIDASTIKVALVLNSAAYNATHDNYDDISANVVGTPQTISAATFTLDTGDGGTELDGGDVTFTALSGSEVGSMVIYKDTGTPSTSQLIAWIDSYTGLPFTPSGADLDITWPAAGILRL